MRLIVTDGPHVGEKYTLSSNQMTSFGRTAKSDTRLSGDNQLSGRHFLVIGSGDTFTIRDLDSTNKTRVNGQEIREATLSDGDEIRAGRSCFRVEIRNPADAAPVPAGHGSHAPPPTPPPLGTPPGGAYGVPPYADPVSHSAPTPPGFVDPLAPSMNPPGGGAPIDHGAGAPANPFPTNPASPFSSFEVPVSSRPAAPLTPPPPTTPPLAPPAPPPSAGGMDDAPFTPTPPPGASHPAHEPHAPFAPGATGAPGRPFAPGPPFSPAAPFAPGNPAPPDSPGAPPQPGSPAPGSPFPPPAQVSSPFQSFSGDAPQGAGAEWEGRWGDARALDGRAIGAMNYFGDGDVASYGAQGGPNGSGGDRASGAFDAASPFDDAHDTPPDGLVLEPSSPSASPPTTASPSPTAAPSPTGPSPVAPVASPTGRPAAPAPVAILSLPGGFKTYEVEPSMNSSLVAYRCLGLDADEPFSAVSMVETLAPQFRTVCTMHFQKIGETTPESIQDASPLFSWLPEPSARQYTPVVVPYDSLRRDGQFGYLDQLWGVDGMLCFLGHDSGAMVTHLKSLVTKGVPGYSEDGGFLPYCWPTVLSQLLMAQPQRVVDSLLGGVISGVLMEVPDLPTGWQILAGREFESALANMGMARMDLEAAR